MTCRLIERLEQSECPGCRDAAKELERLRSIRHAQQAELKSLNKRLGALRKKYVALGGHLPKQRRKVARRPRRASLATERRCARDASQ